MPLAATKGPGILPTSSGAIAAQDFDYGVALERLPLSRSEKDNALVALMDVPNGKIKILFQGADEVVSGRVQALLKQKGE